jgi:hypothetical protein
MINNSLNIHMALLKLAELIDFLENVPLSTKNKKEFRTRRQLISDILDGKEMYQGDRMSKHRTFLEIKATMTLTKYFEDGRIELWLSNEDNEELYLIESYQHPSGKSPIVELKTVTADQDTTKEDIK